MKNPSTEYEAKEIATKRQPAELFRIYDNAGIDEYYTNGDVAISHNSKTWNPAVIKRDQIEYSSNLTTSQLTITVDYLNPVVFYYISYNPPRNVWVEVFKLHRDQDPGMNYLFEVDILFVGVISKVEIQGNSARVTVNGFEGFFEKPVCPKKYQRQCQHQLGDTGCGLNMDSWYLKRAVSSVSADGLTIGISASIDNDVLVLGYMRNYTSNVPLPATIEYRMIVYNQGTTVKIRYPFGNTPIVSETNLRFYYGCSGDITVCGDTFDNLDNFLGFPYIPIDNPARRLLV